jgi:hypothetical protein
MKESTFSKRVFMFSDQVFTKLSLEHILYPISGTTFPQQNHYSNHAFSDLNNFQYFEYTAKNDPFYGKAPPKVAPYEPAHKDYSFEVIHRNTGTSSQATFWPLQTNSTGLLHIFNTFHYFCRLRNSNIFI